MKGLKIGLDVVKGLVIFLGAVFSIMIASNWDSKYAESGWKYVLDNVPDVTNPLSMMLAITWIVLAICIVAAIGFGIKAVAQDPKKNVRALGGIILVVVIGLVAYYGIGDTSLPGNLSVETPSDSMLK
ncbi:MAG: hypothetical protein ACI84C_001675, partial [Flavobacteriales bacterium]